MHKTLTISALALTLSTAGFAATSLPNGSWSGGGQWAASDGTTGTYTDTVTINNNVVDKTVTKSGQTWKLHAAVTFAANNFISAQGTATGPDGKTYPVTVRGFCGLTFSSCLLEGGDARTHLGGAIYFGVRDLYEIGGAEMPGKPGQPGVRVHWDGMLAPSARSVEE